MLNLFEKLNLKDQNQAVVLNTPESLQPELRGHQELTIIEDAQAVSTIDFLLGFGTKLSEVKQLHKSPVKKQKVTPLCGSLIQKLFL
jgi:hypothetical protein